MGEGEGDSRTEGLEVDDALGLLDGSITDLSSTSHIGPASFS